MTVGSAYRHIKLLCMSRLYSTIVSINQFPQKNIRRWGRWNSPGIYELIMVCLLPIRPNVITDVHTSLLFASERTQLKSVSTQIFPTFQIKGNFLTNMNDVQVELKLRSSSKETPHYWKIREVKWCKLTNPQSCPTLDVTSASVGALSPCNMSSTGNCIDDLSEKKIFWNINNNHKQNSQTLAYGMWFKDLFSLA